MGAGPDETRPHNGTRGRAIVRGASYLGQRPSNDQGAEGALFSHSFQSGL